MSKKNKFPHFLFQTAGGDFFAKGASAIVLESRVVKGIPSRERYSIKGSLLGIDSSKNPSKKNLAEYTNM